MAAMDHLYGCCGVVRPKSILLASVVHPLACGQNEYIVRHIVTQVFSYTTIPPKKTPSQRPAEVSGSRAPTPGTSRGSRA